MLAKLRGWNEVLSQRNVKKVLKSALIVTIPVMCGYIFMGIAFGLLLQKAGFNFLWAFFMSVVIYAGTMQYLAIPFLVAQTDLMTVALTTLLVHLRHLVYGLSFIERFKNMGLKKYYMIFGMTDETYALMCSSSIPDGVGEEDFLFLIALLDHIYWIIGCTFGAFAGQFININVKGIDFAMTALFIVICVDQWKAAKTKIPIIIGGLSAVGSLVLFKANNMLIPAIAAIIIILFAVRPNLSPKILEEVKQL